MPVWNKITEQDKLEIRTLFETTELTYTQIAEETCRSMHTVHRYIHATYTPEQIKARKTRCYRNSKLGELNPMTGNFGDKHHNFKGECMDGHGYVIVLRPEWYTTRKRSKHVYLHHVVICEYLGLTGIPRGWNVHHCDGNKLNNSFSNLVLLSSGDHSRLHWYLRRDLEGATTISKESTLKWVEAHGHDVWRRG